jgi:multimeric flavodoxin WrbA
MKVICLLGSPRRDGNSTTIAKRFVETARQLGAETESIELARLVYRGCQACGTCKTTGERCALKDELTPVLEAVEAADLLVLSTPVYCGDLPGQVKCFLDRTYSFLVPDYLSNPKCSRLLPGKRCALIVTQGAPQEELFGDIPKKYSAFLTRVLALSEIRVVRACGVGSGGLDKGVPERFLEEAEQTARAMILEG